MPFHRILLSLAASIALLPLVAQSCFSELPRNELAARYAEKKPRYVAPSTDRVRTALVNVKVWDGYKVLEPSTVLIENGVIVPHVSKVDIVVDGLGGVLLPGLTDSHCHPESVAALEDLASYGVTTALGMACTTWEMCNALRNKIGITQFFTSGIAAHGPGSSLGSSAASIANVSEAPVFVDYAFANGSNYLKIVANEGGPDQALQNSLVAYAHGLGMTTVTHATTLSHYTEAITSKSNGIQHAPADALLTSDLGSRMVKQNQFTTPTLEVARIVLAIAKVNPAILTFLGETTSASYETWQSNVQAMHKAGIPILAGSDAAPQIPLNGTVFGWTLHAELANLVDAGLTTGEALRSATLLPALIFDFPDRGRIAPGMRADLVLLSPGADPSQDIAATKNISRVWIGGLEYTDVATQPFPSIG
jgi:imidazolonepropionase-like amidohydrolase